MLRLMIMFEKADSFGDANTLCYSNFDLFLCSGSMYELVKKSPHSYYESKVWVCDNCLKVFLKNSDKKDGFNKWLN